MTYVVAGGWGGKDNNRIRTQPYKNATAKVKSDLTLPYLTLPYLLVPKQRFDTK